MKTKIYLLMLGCILVGAMLLIAQNAVFAGSSGQSNPLIPDRLSIPYLPGIEEPVYEETLNGSEAQVSDWSRIVYQDMRDKQWDIFFARFGGSGKIGLTDEKGQDLQPRLDRGAKRVVFTSDRDGDFDIYLINVDGSGLKRLADSRADDMMPAWSPDGKTILFTSDRDGQAEIYRVNADGAGLKRLTDHPAFDGRPNWSPDGQRIAFVSTRDNGSYIYVMDANGTNVRRVSTYPTSDDPLWSPDGRTIVFDADIDGDGWGELVLVEADGSKQRKLYDPGKERTVWANAWSPDSHDVAFTQLDLVEYKGDWYWTQAKLRAIDRWAHQGSYVIIEGTSTGWSADWQTTDTSPPSSTLQILPPYARYQPLIASWQGWDNDISGLHSFDVQINQNDSGWQDWLVETTTTQGSLSLPAGTEVGLRVRARDNAFNLEPWPASAQAQTVLFRNYVGGKVTDNRGTALERLPLTLNPAAFQPLVTNDGGEFWGRTWQEGKHILAVNEQGFAPLPLINMPAGLDFAQSFYLQPKDNLVKNGTFEVGSSLEDSWIISGTLPAKVETSARATGDRGLRLGQADLLLQPGTWQEIPVAGLNAATVDGQGILHIVWIQDDAWYYSQRSPDGTWSSQAKIADFTHLAYTPPAMITTDALGRVHLLAADGDGIYYLMRRKDGQWTGKFMLGRGGDKYTPGGITSGGNGQVHILYTQMVERGNYKLQYRIRREDGVWSPLETLSNAERMVGAQLAAAPDGMQHVVWLEERGDGGKDGHYYRHQDHQSGIWSPHSRIDVDEGYYGPFALICDARGGLHLFALYASYDLRHLTLPLNGKWSKPKRIFEGTVRSDGQFTNLAADSQGNLHLLYERWENNIAEQFYVHWDSENGWSAGENWQLDPIARWLLIDSADNLHLLSGEVYPRKFYYGGAATSGSSEEISVSQSLTIPANMEQATLSFMARGWGDLPADESGLQVTITEAGGSPTTVWKDWVTADWQLFWIDLSPWQGQQITVSFLLQLQAADPRVSVMVDDIALGRAAPETWVTAVVHPAAAMKDDIVNMEIIVGNRGAVDGVEPLLTVTLHPSLTFLEATLPPEENGQTLNWDLDTLTPGEQQTIVLQLQVKKRESLGSSLIAKTELDVLGEAYRRNNAAETVVIYGNLSYLPAVVTGR